MDPGTSTREDPIRAHLIKTLGIIGLRHIAKIDILGTDPTPIATPAEEIKGLKNKMPCSFILLSILLVFILSFLHSY